MAALGFLSAHCRCETATDPRCSSVVPNSYMGGLANILCPATATKSPTAGPQLPILSASGCPPVTLVRDLVQSFTPYDITTYLARPNSRNLPGRKAGRPP